jgi:hypothetical protein
MMNARIFGTLLVFTPVIAAVGCSASGGSNTRPTSPHDAAASELDGSTAPDAATVITGGGPSTFWDGATISTIAMPRISAGVPAFASGSVNAAFWGANNANDNDPTTAWQPDQLPAWIAYDLSSVSVDQRQQILVVWNAQHAGTYLNTTPPSGGQMPTDYTIEINAAPGGTSAPPTTGWVQVASIQNNLRDTVETPVSLAGGNWVRMSITGASDPTVSMDLDVFSDPNGATDSWLFMGDSITFITMGYAGSDLPQQVHMARADRWPAVINAALGGTNTQTASMVINDTMQGFPGRYVVLAYGTNDQPDQFMMETLVQMVLAAGKIPSIPHVPWSSDSTAQTNGPLLNAAIDALYVKYPQILKGPDLWAAFENRTDLIPAGDVHPNSMGQEFLRTQWAQVMSPIP